MQSLDPRFNAEILRMLRETQKTNKRVMQQAIYREYIIGLLYAVASLAATGENQEIVKKEATEALKIVAQYIEDNSSKMSN